MKTIVKSMLSSKAFGISMSGGFIIYLIAIWYFVYLYGIGKIRESTMKGIACSGGVFGVGMYIYARLVCPY